MLTAFSKTEMAFRDTLLMKSDAKSFDALAGQYGFPRPHWIPVENWRRALQCVLHGPRGTLHTLRAFLHHALMPWTIPYTWTAGAAVQQWHVDPLSGSVVARPAKQPFVFASTYVPAGSKTGVPVMSEIDLSFRETWLRPIQEAYAESVVTTPAVFDDDGNLVSGAEEVPGGEWTFKPSFVDANGDWIDQTFMGYPKHPWKFHHIASTSKANTFVSLLGFDTGYHAGSLKLITDDPNPTDKVSAEYKALYTMKDEGEGFISPYVISERSGGFGNVGTSLLTKEHYGGEAAHVRIHLFLHEVPVFVFEEGMGTYLICGVPQFQPPAPLGPQQPVDPLVTGEQAAANPLMQYPSGGERLEGQPWGGHMQISELHPFGPALFFPGGMDRWPPYLTGTGDNPEANKYEAGFKNSLEEAIQKLIPVGISWEIIKGWGDGLPSSYAPNASTGTIVRSFPWPAKGYPSNANWENVGAGAAEGSIGYIPNGTFCRSRTDIFPICV